MGRPLGFPLRPFGKVPFLRRLVGFLAIDPSPISDRSVHVPADFRCQRLGVERGTAFLSFLRSRLLFRHHAASGLGAEANAAGARSCPWGCSGPSAGRVTHTAPGKPLAAGTPATSTTVPADRAITSLSSGMKSESGFAFRVKLGFPFTKSAQFRTRPRKANPPGLPKGSRSSQTSKAAPP